MQLGVDPQHAYAFSRTRKGGWAVAQSPILTTTVTLQRLQQRGYESLLDYYFKVSPQFSEPLPTAGRANCVTRMISGVRASPCHLQVAGRATRLAAALRDVLARTSRKN